MCRYSDSVIGRLEFNTYCIKFESQLPTVQTEFLKGPEVIIQFENEINDFKKLQQDLRSSLLYNVTMGYNVICTAQVFGYTYPFLCQCLLARHCHTIAKFFTPNKVTTNLLFAQVNME